MAEAEEETQEKGGVSIKIVLLIIVPVFLISGLGAGMYLAGMFSGGKKAAEEEVEVEEVAKPAIYIPLDPPFVVNFSGADGAKFLQVGLELMTRQVEVAPLVAAHMPAIRNNLVMLFSSQTYQTASTAEGKQELRDQALQVVQEIMQAESGDVGVEAVYFTSFVMQ